MSPTASAPSMRVPVTTVPKPSTENTRSMGRRKGMRRFFSDACRTSSRRFFFSSGRPSPVRAETAWTGLPSRKVPAVWAFTSSRTISTHSGSTMSHLVNTTRPSRMPSRERMPRCSTVWGMKPSSAATTSMARSMPPAPASMFLMNFSCPGTSTMPAWEPSSKSRWAKPSSMVMPRFFSSVRRSVSMPVSALTSRVLPWSTWPAVPMITCFTAAPPLRPPQRPEAPHPAGCARPADTAPG